MSKATSLLLHGVSHSHSYGRGKSAFTVSFTDLSLHLGLGERIGLLGNRRDGSDLLISLIEGDIWPRSGEIYEAGQPLVISARDGFDEAETLLFNLTRLGMMRHMSGVQLRRLVEVVADEAGLADSLDAVVSELDSLAVGRARIYMAVGLGAPVIVIDDPDELGGALGDDDVVAKLGTYTAQGASLVVAAKDINGFRYPVERVVWLVNGEILMDAPIADVRRWQIQYKNAQSTKDRFKIGTVQRRLKQDFGPPAIEVVGTASRYNVEERA